MNVQGLRLFNPRATEDNRVPTVNHNIRDKASTFYFAMLKEEHQISRNNGIFTNLDFWNTFTQTAIDLV